jgi:hypothetical protein
MSSIDSRGSVLIPGEIACGISHSLPVTKLLWIRLGARLASLQGLFKLRVVEGLVNFFEVDRVLRIGQLRNRRQKKKTKNAGAVDEKAMHG